MKNILVTGGCGFIGHHLVEYLLQNTDDNIYIIDKLSYASCGLERLRDIGAMDNPRVKVFIYDLSSKIDEGFIQELANIHWIIHMAADTHVDRSITDPYNCIMNNIHSTINLLEFARKLEHLERFLYFSTDEVYGPALDGKMFTEDSRHNPTNPYSASKSASEMICNSYANTFKIPVLMCNCSNVFGERQHSEKFIPKCIKSILDSKTIKLHCYPNNAKTGSRMYIYAKNVASAVYFIMTDGKLGESYNISGQPSCEIDNDVMADKIAQQLSKTITKEYIDEDSNRPGHDIRYGIDCTKLKTLGWSEPSGIDTNLHNVVLFGLNNKRWISC
jgi:dTDP-glucose 4,6-dehydratase